MFNFKKRQIKNLLKKIKAYQASRENDEPSEAMLKKELKTYYKLIKVYQKLIGKKKYPHAELKLIECYRVAAGLRDKEACFYLGRYMLDEGNCRQELEQEGLFSHPVNERKKNDCYEQAHVYLEAATKLGHTEAMRLLGLCYIHGWGKPAEKDKGFDMVVNSIDRDNAWDKLPEIFARLGLNKPELIAQLMQHRRQ